MAKFYVQSGTMRSVVQAETGRKAVLWAVHEAMRQVLPMEDGPFDSPRSKSERVSSNGVAVLSDRVTVSETGFDHSDASTHPTLDVVGEWNQMVCTLERLERMLYRAA